MGLNTELQALEIAGQRLVIHADLPFVTANDVEALVVAVRGAGALAPDRHGVEVNALDVDTAEDLAEAFRLEFNFQRFVRSTKLAPSLPLCLSQAKFVKRSTGGSCHESVKGQA